MRRLMLAPLALMTAFPVAAVAQDAPLPGEARLAELTAGRVAGAPQSCVSQRDLRGSTIVEGTAIVYRTAGGRLYVNRLRGDASGLVGDPILVTKTTGSQLCRLDRVDLEDRSTRAFRGFVSLGDFVPYDRAPNRNR